MSQLDTSGDDVIDKTEASKAPSVIAAFARLDRNGDGGLSADEVRDRFAFYKDYRNGLMNQTFEVRLNGVPAVGTRVDLVPEPFLENVVKPSSGVTDSMGFVTPTLENAEFPGMQVGLYQAIIYKSQDATEPIPGIAPIGVEASPLGTRDSSAVLDFQKKR
jgi:hypothetical protein